MLKVPIEEDISSKNTDLKSLNRQIFLARQQEKQHEILCIIEKYVKMVVKTGEIWYNNYRLSIYTI